MAECLENINSIESFLKDKNIKIDHLKTDVINCKSPEKKFNKDSNTSPNDFHLVEKKSKNAKKRENSKNQKQEPYVYDWDFKIFDQVSQQIKHYYENGNNKTPKKINKTPKASIKTFSEYEEYMNENEVKVKLLNNQLVLDSCDLCSFSGVKNNWTIFLGSLRINHRNFVESYVTNPIKGETDIIIENVRDRNRALDGDIVVVEIHPKEKWKDGKKTSKVVFIKEKIHSRKAVGILQLAQDKNFNFAAFSPKDSRIPRLRIPSINCPADFFKNPEKYKDILILASIGEWPSTKFAYGCLSEIIGHNSAIENQTKAILLENDLDVSPYSEDVLKEISLLNRIPESEYNYREDLIDQCIFTIDPATAKDLDDSLSCKKLKNGNFEVGVHIADVSFYIPEDSKLNEVASSKATTVYLTDSTYHMLPKELCYLCSLLPGETKLAFSVIWELDSNAEIIDCRFTRTIIKSCVQLSYEHAQYILDNKYLDESKLPTIVGNFTYNDISEILNNLYKLSKILRQNRFDNGALRIDQPKLAFKLNVNTMMPEKFSFYQILDTHRLVEEFMLLANTSVAKRIYNDFSSLALLRNHMEPHYHLLESLQKQLESIGIHLDISSAGAIQKSMLKYMTETNDELSLARSLVLNALLAKPMVKAKYFCANDISTIDECHHYALNTPLYTHFTSPIRRYSDIIVHRQLALSCGYILNLNLTADEVTSYATNCNTKKWSAKKAGEQSSELYLTKYIEMNQPILEKGVVLSVMERSIEVLLINMAISVKVYINNIKDGICSNFEKKDDLGSLSVLFLKESDISFDMSLEVEQKKIEKSVMNIQSFLSNQDKTTLEKLFFEQVIEIFSLVNVVLYANNLKIVPILIRSN